MKSFIKKLLNIDYKHLIAVLLIVVSLYTSISVFPYASVRLGESVVDLWNSFVFYFNFIFHRQKINCSTVQNLSIVSERLAFNLPTTWEEFTSSLSVFGELFVSGENFSAYFLFLDDFLYYFLLVILFLVPFILLLYILVRLIIKSQNNDYNEDTKPLKIWKKIELRVFKPVFGWIKNYIRFLKENKIYLIILALIWAYSFNFYPVIISFFAFYFYFVVSFDFAGIFRQVYKLLLDLSFMFDFVPLILWLIIGFIVLDKIRRKIGYSRLLHREMKNRGFINSLPIVVMGCGTMGSKKTTVITDMGLSQEVMFRDKAFEKILENDLKFPNFPWVNLENVLKVAIEKHFVYSLATCKNFIRRLKGYYYLFEDDKPSKKSLRRNLEKNGFNIGKNFLFEYDFERYGFTYNDQLKIVDIWEVIETYSQLYFFYTIESSLLIANYSVRSDNVLDDIGNFPLWDTDFFHRDTRLQESYSRHAHILDFDMLRLGKKVLEENPYSDLFEFGIVLCTEIGKERGNTLELAEKKKSSPKANQKNDGFESYFKMIRHGGSIENFPFVRVFCDEQRPESWSANGRELCNILHMEQSSELQLAMPLFAVGELFYSLVFSKFENVYSEYRFNRGDNTLFMYLYKGIVAKIKKWYSGIYNRFGFLEHRILLEDGTQDGNTREVIFTISVQKTYSKRFSTDCHSGFYYVKTLRSSLGLEDLPTFAGITATAEELKQEHSYFIDDLNSGLSEFENIKK